MRLVERTTTGHVVEVRLPQEIRLPRSTAIETGNGAQPVNLEHADFLQNKALSQAIHARERRRCFYCLRRTNPRTQCLDHVVPRAHSGRNSYRNLVSCCQECNARKDERSASDFLCGLYRERHLTAAQLAARLRALDALAAGKLPPAVAATAHAALPRVAACPGS